MDGNKVRYSQIKLAIGCFVVCGIGAVGVYQDLPEPGAVFVFAASVIAMLSTVVISITGFSGDTDRERQKLLVAGAVLLVGLCILLAGVFLTKEYKTRFMRRDFLLLGGLFLTGVGAFGTVRTVRNLQRRRRALREMDDEERAGLERLKQSYLAGELSTMEFQREQEEILNELLKK